MLKEKLKCSFAILLACPDLEAFLGQHTLLILEQHFLSILTLTMTYPFNKREMIGEKN